MASGGCRFNTQGSVLVNLTALPEPGQRVEVRRRQFIVTDVVRHQPTEDPLPRGSNGRTHVVKLLSLERDAIDDVGEVIWEIEPDARVHGKPRLPDPSSIDDTGRHDSFLNAVRWSVTDATGRYPGEAGPIVGGHPEEAMLGRRLSEIELPKQDRVHWLKKLREMDWLDSGAIPNRFDLESIVQVGLDFAGYPELIPADSNGKPVEWSLDHPFFLVPSLRGSWAECVHGLKHPDTGELRAITFDHEVAAGKDDVVLCHLNHPLMRMCRGLVCAEAWADEEKRKLSRFSIKAAPDSVGVNETLLVYARLLITGGSGRLLHEEIIRSGIDRFFPGKMTRTTLREEQHAELYGGGGGYYDKPEIHRWFTDIWTKSDELETAAMRALDARADERMKSLQQIFAKRQKYEISGRTKELKDLVHTIREELEAEGPDRRGLNVDESERRENDAAALRERLKSINSEIHREKLAVRDRYSELRTWVLPVAMTYVYLHPINLG